MAADGRDGFHANLRARVWGTFDFNIGKLLPQKFLEVILEVFEAALSCLFGFIRPDINPAVFVKR
jgi:hypothetical protein